MQVTMGDRIMHCKIMVKRQSVLKDCRIDCTIFMNGRINIHKHKKL